MPEENKEKQYATRLTGEVYERKGKLDKNGCLRDQHGRLMKGTKQLSTKGSKQGIKHRVTQIREAFYEAFQRIGGIDELVKWIQANPRNKKDFYNLVIKILPREIDLKSEHEEVRLILVRPAGAEGEEQTTLTINKQKEGNVEIGKPIKYITNGDEPEGSDAK